FVGLTVTSGWFTAGNVGSVGSAGSDTVVFGVCVPAVASGDTLMVLPERMVPTVERSRTLTGPTLRMLPVRASVPMLVGPVPEFSTAAPVPAGTRTALPLLTRKLSRAWMRDPTTTVWFAVR